MLNKRHMNTSTKTESPCMPVNARSINSAKGTSSKSVLLLFAFFFLVVVVGRGLHIFEDVPLVEFMYLVFIRMSGESYCGRFGCLLLFSFDVFKR